MIVLGIHAGHDSSAAIVKDGKIVADVQEERFNRQKHSNNIPIKSIEYCLKACRLSDINEADKISFSWINTPPGIDSLFGLEPKISKKESLAREAAWLFFGKALGVNKLKVPIYYPNYTLNDKRKFVSNEHHLAHAASAFYTRKSADRCLVFTLDGAGDNVCTAIWLAEGNKIEPLKKYFREASIGWAYSVVTEGLHWWHGDGEGKTMGLAPYGDCTKCAGVLDKYFPTFDGEKLKRDSKLGKGFYWYENGSTQFHFDEAYEAETFIVNYGKEHIAAEAQRKLEDNVMNLVFGWVKKTGVKKIACAGGVFLNVKLNQRIWNSRAGFIEECHVYPNPGDAGLAVGAALLEYYRHTTFRGSELNSLYLGPEYDNEAIGKLLKIRKIPYERVEHPAPMAAKYLAENKIVAWFQGRMEAGPRSLGNRSILMSPLRAENKDILNAWVKFREGFRPFCPSLLWEKKDEYLKDCKDEFFMITSFDVTPEKRSKIPAVVHVDGTVRPQMVKKEINPLYWELINEFGKLTGEYIILNTSFNVMGEPIINTPSEAIKCFFDSGMDAIFLGNYMLRKF
jgi:carbamoyltransferase